MKQETENDSGIFSEAEIKSIIGLMEIMDSRLPLEQKRKLLTEGIEKHCQIVLGGAI